MINARAVPALPAQHRRIVSPVSPFKDFADPLCSPPTTWPPSAVGRGFGENRLAVHQVPAQPLDRLAAWQQYSDHNYRHDTDWRWVGARHRWAHNADDLAADVQAALGTRAELAVDLWPPKENT